MRIQGDAAMFFISHLLSETSIEANRGGGVVVPADNGVNEQTANSIACACQAGVPLLIAVNKMDLPSADPGRVLTNLVGYEILTEDLGGDVLCSQISAKEGTNLDKLLSKVLLQAEVLDLKANPDRDAQDEA